MNRACLHSVGTLLLALACSGQSSTSGAAAGAGGQGTSGTSANAGASGSAGSSGAASSCEAFPLSGPESCSRTNPACPPSTPIQAVCSYPDDPPQHGCPNGFADCVPLHECNSDADCANGVCETYPALCCREGVYTNTCAPRCNATSCPSGEQCGASGRCEFPNIQCPAPWEPTTDQCPCSVGGCAANHDCQSIGGHAVCARRSCTSAADCDCGVCQDGLCEPDPNHGICHVSIPTP